MSCNPPYERGHGGYCSCNCKCLAPECWDKILVEYDCNEGASLIPIGEGAIIGTEITCEEGFKICPGINGASDYCQNENFPCVGYDCQIEGCAKSPYISGMYYTYSDCLNYCINQEQKYLNLAPSEVFIDGKICPNGTCPDNPTWICCLDGSKCAATYADCPCSCIGKQGCTNPHSNNYDPDAKCDDGSCITCCNALKCVVDDRDGTANCNRLPLIDGFAGGTDGCCDAYCVEAGDCHPSYTNSHTVPAENSCSGESFTYSACNACTFTTTTTTSTTSYPYKICYRCPIPAGPNSCAPMEFQDDGATTCSDYNSDTEEYYDSESECLSLCATTPPPYKICYSCLETAIGGNCMPVPVSYGSCSDYTVPGNTFYDSPEECETSCETTKPPYKTCYKCSGGGGTNNCQPIEFPDDGFTTCSDYNADGDTFYDSPEECDSECKRDPCIIEVITDGCCLEYSGGAIYAVGRGNVTATTSGGCCKDFRVLVNGKIDTNIVQDGDEVTIEGEAFECPCEEVGKEPKDPSPASCPPKPSSKPIIVLDKKTNKIKILLKRN